MLGQERLAPEVSVTFACLLIPAIPFVGSSHLFRMLCTKPSFGQPPASRMAARSLGLVGSRGHSLGQKESPGGIPELSIGLV